MNNLITEAFSHRTEVPDYINPGELVTFKWHWPRGTFRKRMSAYEISSFILPHMPNILPFFSESPKIYAEFQAMLVMLATNSKKAIDELLPWVKSVTRTEADDIIEMQLFAKEVEPGPKYFVMP